MQIKTALLDILNFWTCYQFQTIAHA